MEGIVKSVVSGKGYGFIKVPNGQEYFFHRSCCLCRFEELWDGAPVKFEGKNTPKGWRAEQVDLA